MLKLPRGECCGSCRSCEGGLTEECGCELYPRKAAAGAQVCEGASVKELRAIGVEEDVDASRPTPVESTFVPVGRSP